MFGSELIYREARINAYEGSVAETEVKSVSTATADAKKDETGYEEALIFLSCSHEATQADE